MSRLKKIAEIQELNELDMPSNVLNSIIQVKDHGDTVGQVVYRRLMNQNTKFVVEIWELAGDKYVVFSGHYQGQWTSGNIEMSQIFDSLNEAQLYVQNDLQGEAELNELVVGKRLNNFRKHMAKGGEPNYKQIAKDFQKEVNIPDVEMKHKDHLNKYYQQFEDYMNKYYPEWSHYPAYIWRGWNYFTNQVAPENKDNDNDEDDKSDNKDDSTSTQQEQPTQDTPTQDTSVQEETDPYGSDDAAVSGDGGDSQ